MKLKKSQTNRVNTLRNNHVYCSIELLGHPIYIYIYKPLFGDNDHTCFF